MRYIKSINEWVNKYDMDDVFLDADNPESMLDKILKCQTIEELESVSMFMDDVIMNVSNYMDKDDEDIVEEIKQQAKEYYHKEFIEKN